MLAEASRILPSLLLWPWLRLGAPVPLPVGAGGWSRLCLPQEASQAAAAATGPCPGLGDGFFSLCVAAGTVYNRKKKKKRESERERE